VESTQAPCLFSFAVLVLDGTQGLVFPGPPHSCNCVGRVCSIRSCIVDRYVGSRIILLRVMIRPRAFHILDARKLLARPLVLDFLNCFILSSLFRLLWSGLRGVVLCHSCCARFCRVCTLLWSPCLCPVQILFCWLSYTYTHHRACAARPRFVPERSPSGFL